MTDKNKNKNISLQILTTLNLWRNLLSNDEDTYLSYNIIFVHICDEDTYSHDENII